MGEVGERLREAREAKGLTLEQVEEITRIRRRYLQALEEEDYDQLPGEVYVRGFLRNYAQVVGLNPEEILAAGGRRAPSPVVPLQDVREPYLDEPLEVPQDQQRLVAILIGAMVVIALGLGGWTFWRYLGLESILPASAQPTATETPVAAEDEATPRPTFTPLATSAPEVAATPSVTNTAEPTAIPPTPVPEIGVLLRLEATQASWVHVEVDGGLAYEATMAPGQALEWRGNEQIFLRTGNAGGLRIWYNGQEEAPLGPTGAVEERTWTGGPLPVGEGPGAPAEVTPGPVGPPPTPVTPTPTPAPSG
jgi:cytoskeleton protein RodZ